MAIINRRRAIIWKYPDLEHGEDKDYYEVNREDVAGDSEWHWYTSKYPKPSEAELQEWTDAQAHLAPRRISYPNIGDQLDDLYHEGAFSAAMTAKIKKVKDDNPKG